MAPGATTSDGVSVGRVLSRTFAVIAGNPVATLATAFLLAAVPNGILGYFVNSYRIDLVNQPDGFRDASLLTGAAGLVTFLLTMIVQGALVRATVDHAEGRAASVGEVVTTGLRMVLPLIVVAIVVFFTSFVAAMFFIVPGVIIYTMWSVASPALVEERIGIFRSLGRSTELTSGARWKVFGLNLIILVVIWFISAVVGLLQIVGAGSVQQIQAAATSPVLIVANALFTTLMTAFWGVAQSSLYVELRDWKDGPQVDRLGEVFA